MKKVILIPLWFIVMGLTLSSCRGSAGKKAATEAMEFLEKKGGKYLKEDASKLYREEESSASRVYKNYKIKKRAKRVQDFIERIGEDDEEPSYREPQPVAVVCNQCGGNGAVYLLDGYGNIMYDYYGNPQVVACPSCGGTGQVVVYQ